MPNIVDYLAWRGDLTFAKSAFNPVDNLIFSVIAYLPFEGIVSESFSRKGISFAEASRLLQKRPAAGTSERTRQNIEFFAKAATTQRFAACRLSGYRTRFDKKTETQFAAVTISCSDGSYYVAFRGTDATVVGWKEDFNMSFMTPVPAQRLALEYLEEAAWKLGGKIRVGGHSKGGNLAFYAAAFCKPGVQRRIIAAYNNDGPGFDERFITEPGFRAISARLLDFVPQSSVIGMLLEHGEQYTVVESTQRGIAQHDPYSWVVLGADFVRKEDVTDTSKFVDSTIKEWLKAISPAERERFIDALFSILESTEITNFSELSSNWFQRAKAIGEALKNMDEPTRKMLLKTLGLLVETVRQNIKLLMPFMPNTQQENARK